MQHPEDYERRVGDQVRTLRIDAGLDQRELADRANLSLGTVQAIERGRGSTLGSLIRVARALDRAEWLDELDPAGDDISPIEMLRASRRRPAKRQRVSRSR
jgi:transcriptional regulator with XRE-family HTH domain